MGTVQNGNFISDYSGAQIDNFLAQIAQGGGSGRNLILRMLQETSLPITQVAFESGFQSLRSFNHVCISIFGQTPTELRRRARGTQ